MLRFPSRIVRAAAAALLLSVAPVSSAWALSEIQREELPPPGAQPPAETPEAATPEMPPPAEAPQASPEATPDAAETPDAPDTEATQVERVPPPPVEYDLAKLPEPVRRMHDRLIEACKTGDPEQLRQLLETGESATQISVGPVEGDPIAYLKTSSGDGGGLELLAILQDVLSAGYVHLDAGEPDELYVWPYFFAVPLDSLTDKQKVELFRILTAGDFEEMQNFGSYVFYRVGITPEGRWAFFLAGD